MEEKKNNDTGGGGSTLNAANPKPGFESQEKTSLGGSYNSGVTSDDLEEKNLINKKATLGEGQPSSQKAKKRKRIYKNK